MQTIKSVAIALSSFQQGEANRIIEFFTEEAGKVRAIAHGARKMNSRFGAAHETGTLLRVVLSSSRRSTLLTVRESEIITPFSRIKGSLDELQALLDFLKLLSDVTYFNAPDPYLFRRGLSLLRFFEEKHISKDKFLLYIRLLALEILGALPEWGCCSRCHNVGISEMTVSQQGVYCAACLPNEYGKKIVIPENIIKILQRLSRQDMIGRDQLVVAPQQYKIVTSVLNILLEEQMRVDRNSKKEHYKRTGFTL